MRRILTDWWYYGWMAAAVVVAVVIGLLVITGNWHDPAVCS